MNLIQKRMTTFVAFLLGCTAIGLITGSATRIASANNSVFFDERFLFLNAYTVNDFIPVSAMILVALGWLCAQWAIKFMPQKITPDKRALFVRILIASLPLVVFFILLVLLVNHVRFQYPYTASDLGLYTFATNQLFFFEGGFILNIAFYMYGRIQQQEQKPVSQ